MAKCASPSRTSSQRRRLSLLNSQTSGFATTRSPDSCKMRGCKSSQIPSTRCFSALTTKHLRFEPGTGCIGGIAEGKVHGVHQTLASLIEGVALTHSIHCVPEGHAVCRVGKS